MLEILNDFQSLRVSEVKHRYQEIRRVDEKTILSAGITHCGARVTSASPGEETTCLE